MTSTQPTRSHQRRTRPGRAAPTAVRRRKPATLFERRLVWGIAAAGGVAAMFAGCEPTGTALIDPLLTGAFAVLVSLAASRARRWTWVVLAGVGAAASEDPWMVALAATALVIAILGGLRTRSRALGAAVGALALQVLLRLPDLGFSGASTLVAAAGVIPVLASAYLLLPRRQRNQVHQVTLRASIFVGVALFLLLAAAAIALNDANRGVARAREALGAVADGDQQGAADLFEASEASIERANGWLGSVLTLPAKVVPLLGQQAWALDQATAHAATVADRVGIASRVADPNEFRYVSGRIDLDLLRNAQQPLVDASEVMADAATAIDRVDSPWLLSPIANRLGDFDAELEAARVHVDLAAQGALVAPGMLGGDGPKRYLVMFLQPAEARGLGGFMGAWVELTAIDGELEVSDSGRANTLNTAPGRDERELSGSDDYVARYARFRPEYYLQDVPFSPDFPTVAEVMAGLYPQAGGRSVDGVFAVDPAGLAALMRITGPVRLPGTGIRLTADTAEDFLLRDQYLTFEDAEGDRQDVLEDAGRETFELLVSGDIPAPRRLGDILGPVTSGRDIMAHSFSPEGQAFFDRLGVAGAIEPGGSDAMMLVTQNKGNNKIDTFLYRRVDYSAEYDPDTGRLSALATITLRNDAPASGLPNAIIGSNDQGLPLGTNALFFSFYTPHALSDARLDGEPVGVEVQRELGLRVYSRFLEIPPGESRVIELELEGSLESGSVYELDIFRQPLPNPDDVRASIRASRRWYLTDLVGFTPLPDGFGAVSRLVIDRPERLHASFDSSY
jgi:hypothetical protein